MPSPPVSQYQSRESGSVASASFAGIGAGSGTIRLAPASGVFWATAVPAVIAANNAKAIHFRISFMAFSISEARRPSGPVARLLVKARGAHPIFSSAPKSSTASFAAKGFARM
jgi:hypothetical protein